MRAGLYPGTAAQEKTINLPQIYICTSFVLPSLRVFGMTGWLEPMCTQISAASYPVLLAVISVYFIKQAVDEEGPNNVANISAHELRQPSKI